MHTRFVTVAAAALALAARASAEPPKTPAPQSNAPQTHSTAVVLASADHVTTTPPAAETGGPAKPHRTGRVTTCRCGGDPQPEPEEQQ